MADTEWLNRIAEKLSGSARGANVIIPIAIMLFLGFVMTRATKKLRLPHVTAYIVTGILIGPFCMNLIPKSFVAGTDFLTDIALAFIAFGTGEFFTLSSLRANGMKALVITLFEAGVASAFVFILTRWAIGMDAASCVVLSALAAATAPTSTIMTIRQTRARGDFVDTLLQVIAVDDVLALIAYSVAISLAVSLVFGGSSGNGAMTFVRPVLLNLGGMAVGGIFAWLMKWLMPSKRSTDNRLIISVSVLFLFCGLCAMFDISPLLGCMAMGIVYAHIAGDDKLFRQLNYFSPPILLLFFVRSGMRFDLGALTATDSRIGTVSLFTVGVLYCAVRILGKYIGAYIGCRVAGKPERTRTCMGLALVPQASVAIGLAALCARALGPELGGTLQTIILTSSVLNELVGPACAKYALYASGAYSNSLEEMTEVERVTPEGATRSRVELLIERLGQIQAELPEHAPREIEAEQAFTEAAQESYEPQEVFSRGRFLNRR